MPHPIKSLYYFASRRYKNLFLEYHTDFKPRYPVGSPHPQLEKIIAANHSGYAALLTSALTYQEQLLQINTTPDQGNAAAPHWNNGFLPGLDIVMIYTILAEFRPKRYVEVGSGNSTKVAFKAKTEQHPQMEIISIDPHPRAEIDQLSNKIYRQPVENLNLDLAGLLEPGDVLFIDNSHRILPNSDSMVFFMETLPALKPGVIVHVHDVYLPYDYPQFMCDRFYSEQYGLAFYLLANPARFEVIAPNFYLSETPELAEILNPLWEKTNLRDVERHGGSFWFKING